MEVLKVAAVIVCIRIIISIIFMLKRNKQMAYYRYAKKSLDQGDRTQALHYINKAIKFPRRGKYTNKSVERMILYLKLLKLIAREEELENNNLIEPVINALAILPKYGGSVDKKMTRELKKWINNISQSIKTREDQKIEEVKHKNPDIIEAIKETDFIDEIIDIKELDVINSIGSYILGKNFKAGVNFLNENMPSEMNTYKAALLEQKARLLFMSKNVEVATDVYKEILESYPTNNRIMTSLSECLMETGRTEEAVRHAITVVNNSKDKELVQKCKKILGKYED